MVSKIKSIGRKYESAISNYIPLQESEELREEVVDETRTVKEIWRANKSNPLENLTKRIHIDLIA